LRNVRETLVMESHRARELEARGFDQIAKTINKILAEYTRTVLGG
jgi:hypothetical protein